MPRLLRLLRGWLCFSEITSSWPFRLLSPVQPVAKLGSSFLLHQRQLVKVGSSFFKHFGASHEAWQPCGNEDLVWKWASLVLPLGRQWLSVGPYSQAAFPGVLALLLAGWCDLGCRRIDVEDRKSSACFPELGTVREFIRAKFLHKSLAHSRYSINASSH